MGKLKVRVTTLESEMEFKIKASTMASQLFAQLCQTIGLTSEEAKYFGLAVVDTTDHSKWLKLNKKVLSQNLKKQSPLEIKFRVKLWPENVTHELIQDNTIRLFYLEVRAQILSGKIFCPPTEALRLASYAMQATYGDFTQNNALHLANDLTSILPPSALQDDLENEQLIQIILSWKQHEKMTREDAMMKYLQIAQELDMYGVTYYEIRNKNGTELYIGIDSSSLKIYEQDNKLTPVIRIPWSKVNNVTYIDCEFRVKPFDKEKPDFVFISAHSHLNKEILSLCLQNHSLYTQRRKPPSLQVKLMRDEARELKLARQSQRLSQIKIDKAPTAPVQSEEVESQEGQIEGEKNESIDPNNNSGSSPSIKLIDFRLVCSSCRRHPTTRPCQVNNERPTHAQMLYEKFCFVCSQTLTSDICPNCHPLKKSVKRP